MLPLQKRLLIKWTYSFLSMGFQYRIFCSVFLNTYPSN